MTFKVNAEFYITADNEEQVYDYLGQQTSKEFRDNYLRIKQTHKVHSSEPIDIREEMSDEFDEPKELTDISEDILNDNEIDEFHDDREADER